MYKISFLLLKFQGLSSQVRMGREAWLLLFDQQSYPPVIMAHDFPSDISI